MKNGVAMTRLDHLALKVSNLALVRDWYTSVLGLDVEFDTDRGVGLKDDGDFTLILTPNDGKLSLCSLYFQVEDVASAYADIVARGVTFLYAPQSNDWGYGAGLLDPDGRVIGLWDQESMARHMAGTDS
jgi:catechol 2,3-dioxygenase-like lactoylglutathione lyase family enzyme